jgi:hypothetical protein
MRVADDVQKSVVFIGHGESEEFVTCGTGFFMEYDQTGYLVTAQHIALQLGNDPFALRLNEIEDGKAGTIQIDPAEDVAALFPWISHSDPTVDLAVFPMPFALRQSGFDCLFLAKNMMLTQQWAESESVGIGNFCYAAGLFSLHAGKKRILPVLHTGHIAMMPSKDELVPAKDWTKQTGLVEIEAYLVELTNLEGLSGAPVFVRPEVDFTGIPFDDGRTRDTALPQATLFLMGDWQGSWTAPIDHTRSTTRVPVGMGIVVPAEKLIELFESAACKEAREKWLAAIDARNAPGPDGYQKDTARRFRSQTGA